MGPVIEPRPLIGTEGVGVVEGRAVEADVEAVLADLLVGEVVERGDQLGERVGPGSDRVRIVADTGQRPETQHDLARRVDIAAFRSG